jgi:hypothetical protein
MRFGYGWLCKRLTLYSKQLVLLLGLFALPITSRLEKVAICKPLPPPRHPQPADPDPRAVRLKNFLARLHCPVTYLAEDFIHAADENHLDWRLLPSISIIESSGGKAYKNNNIFGWDQGEQLFPTIRAGINEVAFKLGRSPLYRNRDSAGKLRVYNPDESYAGLVTAVMNRISPVENLTPVRRVIRQQNEFVYSTN